MVYFVTFYEMLAIFQKTVLQLRIKQFITKFQFWNRRVRKYAVKSVSLSAVRLRRCLIVRFSFRCETFAFDLNARFGFLGKRSTNSCARRFTFDFFVTKNAGPSFGFIWVISAAMKGSVPLSQLTLSPIHFSRACLWAKIGDRMSAMKNIRILWLTPVRNFLYIRINRLYRE